MRLKFSYVKLSCLVVLVLISLTGCVGKLLNPYESDFSCPNDDPGQCATMRKAYEASLNQGWHTDGAPVKNKDGKTVVMPPVKMETQRVEDLNTIARFERQTSLIQQPVTPIVAPPKVERILFFPYQDSDKKTLYMARYVYYITEDPTFVLGDYLYQEGEE